VPNDIWLGQYDGWSLVGAVAFQVVWALLLLALCEIVLRAATRKVVVQGG
jgi:ABC-2 type transport system permease protein